MPTGGCWPPSRASREPAGQAAAADHPAWLFHRSGPARATTILQRLEPAGVDIGRAEVLATRRALYPDGDTALAYLTLFAMRTGIVPDGIDALTLADITRTSPSTMLLSYSKGRPAGRRSTCPATRCGCCSAGLSERPAAHARRPVGAAPVALVLAETAAPAAA